MISMRHHVVSLVAVFLALAIGIALGGGPLGGSASSDTSGGGDDEAATAAAATSGARQAATSEYADAFAAVGAARLYDNGLHGHAVAVLAMPGADSSQVKALNAQVLAAGGAITGTYTLGETALDADSETTVEEVGTELMTQLADPRLDADASTYQRFGQLVALAMSTDQQSSVRADPAAVAARAALEGKELLSSPADVRSAPLALVVLPPGRSGLTDSVATQDLLAALVNGLASNAAGVVVTGDEDSQQDGELAALRAGDLTGSVATVDGLETALGQVTAVLALTSVVTGTSGSYGASGADGPVPLQ